MTARSGLGLRAAPELVQRHPGPAVVVLGTAWLLASVAVGGVPGGDRLLTLGLAASAALAACVLATRVAPAHILCAGVALGMFSGNWPLLGMPFGVDRIVVLAGVLAAFAESLRDPEVRLVCRPVHLGLAAATGVALVSALWAGTAGSTVALYALMDRYGVVPFLAFFVAPYAFREARHRTALLATLVGMGGYLGLTAVLEKLGPRALVVPRYILDPTVGLHAERARGPFLEAAANGAVLVMCAAACLVAVTSWSGRPRTLAGVALALCVAGVGLTLTRSAWLALVLATAVTLLSQRRLWRYLLPAAGVGVLAAALLLTLPGLSDSTRARAEDQSPVWDRANLVTASVNIIRERPLTGVGWSRYSEASPDYFRQAPDYPQQGEGLVVHNVPLLYVSELGVPGFLLWLAVAVVALGRPLFPRRGPPWVDDWRTLHAGVLVAWVTVGMFAPLSQALPNLLVFLVAGVLASRVDAIDPVTPRA